MLAHLSHASCSFVTILGEIKKSLEEVAAPVPWRSSSGPWVLFSPVLSISKGSRPGWCQREPHIRVLGAARVCETLGTLNTPCWAHFG